MKESLLRRAITRALDEASAEEHEREHEEHQVRMDQERKSQADLDNRELLALERIAIALQNLSESVSRISCSGIHVHTSR